MRGWKVSRHVLEYTDEYARNPESMKNKGILKGCSAIPNLNHAW